MWRFAWKSLWRDRLRFGITVSGVALSVLLILVMNGLFAGASRQITSYIDFSRADLFLAQSGVRNMHMANSVLPAALLDEVRAVPGVTRAEGIVYFPASLEWQGASDSVYVIGIAPDSEMGGPWSMAQGQGRPQPGEVVISDRQRRTGSPRLGETVVVAGRELKVSGLSRETKSIASTLVFINLTDAQSMRGQGLFNYLLLRSAPGSDLLAVSLDVGEQVPDANVLTRQEMSDRDQLLALQMGVELLGIMALVGFVIGMAVIALTTYISVVEQIRQYGLLKAVGAGPVHLLAGIFGQALLAAVAGFAVGIVLSAGVSALVPTLAPGLEIDLVPGYSTRLFGLVLLMGAISALPPFWRVQRVDPVDVFRP